MASNVLITPASSKIEFTDGSNSTKTLNISGVEFNLDSSLVVTSNTASSTILKVNGTNGTLLSVVDDLSDSLLSANNSAGLPVFEVFADDRIVAGQYGQNDLVLKNNRLGLGTASPVGKLDINGTSSNYSTVWLRETSGNVAINFDVETAASTFYNWRMDVQGIEANAICFVPSTTTGGTTFTTPALKINQNGNVTATTFVGALNGNASSASAIPSHTLWGQNFDGTNNVSGNLSNVGNITGTAGITISAGGSDQNITLTPSGTGYTLLNGNIGIGVTPSAWSSYGSTIIQLPTAGTIVSSNSIAYYGANWFYNGQLRYNSNAPASYYSQNSGVHTWLNAPSGIAGATQSVTSGQQYTVTTTGNTNLGQWQANFSGISVLPSVGQIITCTNSGTLAGTATVTQIATFATSLTISAAGLGTASGSWSFNGVSIGRGGNGKVENTAVGNTALSANTDGIENVALGLGAGYSNTTGNFNTFIGAYSGYYSITGSNNTAIGKQSLNTNKIGSYNTSIGSQALFYGTTQVATVTISNGGSGYGNGTYSNVQLVYVSGSTATNYPTANITVSGGAVTLVSIVNGGVGFKDTTTVLTALAAALGGTGSGLSLAVATLTSSEYNTAVGYQAGYNVTSGKNNTIIGPQAGYSLTIGSNNTFVGGANSGNTYAAGSAITTGGGNTILGNYSGNNGGLDIRTSNNYIVLSDGAGNPRQVIDNSGNVIIGTVSVINNCRLSIADAALKTNVGYCLTFGTATGGANDFQLIIQRGSNSDGYYSFQAVEQNVGYKNISFNASGGNVGVGFTGPANKLSVNGAASIGSNYNTAGPANGLIVEGNVGIGVTNPAVKLEVAGVSMAGTGSYRASLFGDNGGAYLFFGTTASTNILGTIGTYGALFNINSQNGPISFQFSGSEKVRIDNSTGNVGIGITSPSSRLHVNSTTSGATLIRADGTSGTLFSVIDDLTDSLLSVNNNAGLPVFEVFADDRVVMGQYGQNDLVVRNNKVGIGSNNPSAKLEVVGSLIAGGVDNGSVIFYRNTNPVTIGNTDSVLYVSDRSSSDWGITVDKVGYDYGLRINVANTASYALAIHDGTNYNVRLYGNGNAYFAGNTGIGITPYSKLTVAVPSTNTISTADASNTAGITVSGTGNLVRLQLGVGANTLGPYGGWIQASYDNGGGSNGVEPLLLNPSGGNVGIGVTSAAYKLDVDGIINTSSDIYALGGRLSLYRSAGSSYIDWADTRSLVFRTVGSVGGGATVTTLVTLNSTGLGIGTTSPSTKLDVVSAGDGEIRVRATSDPSIIFSETTGNKNWKIKPSAGDFYFQYSATAYNSGYSSLAVLTASGNLGIGVTPKAWRTTDKAIQLNAYTALQSNDAGDTGLMNNCYYNSGGSAVYINNGYATRYEQYQGVHTWYNAGNGTATNTFTFSPKMTLDASGNLGLSAGYITAGSATSVAGSKILAGNYSNGAITTFGSEQSNGGPVLGYGVWPATTGAGAFVSSSGVALYRGAYTIRGANHYWFGSGIATSIAVDSAVSLNQFMTLDASGNLAIGATSATGRLSVVGDYSFFRENASGADVYIRGYYGNANQAAIQVASNSPLLFLTNNTTRVLITNAGNVGIGTTNPVGVLDVRAGSGEIIFGTYDLNYVVKIQSGDQLNFYNGASATAGYINYGGGATVLSQNLHVEKSTGGTVGVVRIKADGKIGIGTTAPATLLQINTGSPTSVTGGIQFGDDTGTRIYRGGSSNITISGSFTESSSIRYKENIKNIDVNILPKLCEIRPVTYNKKDNKNNREYGIIAEELYELFPELINKNDNGEIESVNYSRLTVLLIKSVKELKEEVEKLKNK